MSFRPVANCTMAHSVIHSHLNRRLHGESLETHSSLDLAPDLPIVLANFGTGQSTGPLAPTVGFKIKFVKVTPVFDLALKIEHWGPSPTQLLSNKGHQGLILPRRNSTLLL